MEVLLKRRTRVVLAVALAAMMLLLASEVMAAHGGFHRSQPTNPPGNPDSGIRTGGTNQFSHGNPGGPTDTGPSQVVVSPSLVQQA